MADDDLFPIATVAKFANLTVRRLQQLAAEGHVPKPVRGRIPMLQTLNAVIRYYQQRASEGSKKLSEDARLRAAQASLRELELRKAQGDLLTGTVVRDVFDEVMAIQNAGIQALAARCSIDCTGKSTREIKEIIQNEARNFQRDFAAGVGRLALAADRRRRKLDASQEAEA